MCVHLTTNVWPHASQAEAESITRSQEVDTAMLRLLRLSARSSAKDPGFQTQPKGAAGMVLNRHGPVLHCLSHALIQTSSNIHIARATRTW